LITSRRALVTADGFTHAQRHGGGEAQAGRSEIETRALILLEGQRLAALAVVTPRP
jgi:hypothetical protein